jgi:hypothetical protein
VYQGQAVAPYDQTSTNSAIKMIADQIFS